MPSGLIALLDDIATLTKLAAASVDDVGAAAGRASFKAAGVVIDDTAVTPRYVVGLAPERELPIIGKIAMGSLRNKMLILLPAALLLSAFAKFLIVPLLMLGGAFLAFEASEKILEKFMGEQHHSKAELLDAVTDPAELEKMQVAGAVRTDFILSAEIMFIALNELPDMGLVQQGIVLAVVGIAITIGVYGAVALIVKMDDVGLHLGLRGSAAARAFGHGLLWLMPRLLTALSLIGTAAMLWVGGGIVMHGMEEYHFTPAPVWVHDAAHAAGEAAGSFAEWLVTALGSAVIGLIVGALIVAVLHLIPRKKAAAAH